MKVPLRKHLRAQRRSLGAADHRYRSRLAAKAVFGIAVPSSQALPTASRWLNLIVIPLVGVDALGRRLGMGGGFYDRALEFRRRRRNWPGPRLVGLAFDCQRTDSSFAEPWDLRLDSLATESGLQHYSR